MTDQRRTTLTRSRSNFATALAGLAASSPIAACLMAAPAQAQPPQPAPTVLPTIPVTAAPPPSEYRAPETGLSRVQTNVMDTPQSVTVIPQALIRDQASTTLRESLRNVSGISINAGEGGAQGDSVNLRGFLARGDFYRDGIRDFGQYTRDTFNLEQIDVLKGPSSILFGRGTTGGVINMVSKAPRAGASFTEATGTLGYPLYGRFSADTNQVLSDNAAMRLNFLANDQQNPGRDSSTVKRYGFAPSVTVGLGGATQFNLSFLYQNENNRPDNGVTYVGNRPAVVPRNTAYTTKNGDWEDVTLGQMTARLDHRFDGPWRLSSVLRFGSVEYDVQTTNPRNVGNPTPRSIATGRVNRTSTSLANDVTQMQSQTEVGVTFNTYGLRHNAVAGVDLGVEQATVTRYATTTITTVPFLDPPPDATPARRRLAPTSIVEGTGNSQGAFVSDQIKIGDRVDVLLGARWDRFNLDFNSQLNNQFLEQTDTMFSQRAAVLYHPIRNWGVVRNTTVYVAYGTSFNPSAEYLALQTSNFNLDPEETESYEAGVKVELFQQRLGLSTALFRIDKVNARTVDPDNAALNTLDGQQRVDGVEFEVNGRITREWNIFAGVALMKPEIVESNDVIGGIRTQGKIPANTPQQTFNLWTTYDLPMNVTIGGGVFHVGHRYASNANTIKVPGYWRTDLMVAWQVHPAVRLQVNALNVFNETTYDQVYTAHVVPGIGRTVLAGTTMRF